MSEPTGDDRARAAVEAVYRSDSRCVIGSWGGRRPSLGGYVTVTGATGRATAGGGRSCRLSSRDRSPEIADPLRRFRQGQVQHHQPAPDSASEGLTHSPPRPSPGGSGGSPSQSPRVGRTRELTSRLDLPHPAVYSEPRMPTSALKPPAPARSPRRSPSDRAAVPPRDLDGGLVDVGLAVGHRPPDTTVLLRAAI
jgi:hypothetical protein